MRVERGPQPQIRAGPVWHAWQDKSSQRDAEKLLNLFFNRIKRLAKSPRYVAMRAAQISPTDSDSVPGN
jgi:hypothetical protein